jgi:hypothetical protein
VLPTTILMHLRGSSSMHRGKSRFEVVLQHDRSCVSVTRKKAVVAVLYQNRLCCAVLCCAVLCCAVLCCAVLCCAVLCCAVLCCAVLCRVGPCCPTVQQVLQLTLGAPCRRMLHRILPCACGPLVLARRTEVDTKKRSSSI